ncbi:hypothetical protein [Roseivirga sp. E12]|uniref:hypothetical protein n=1 Tax=Roseivirga sp. E12 TaxID=2819237 RepID=UPI001ABC56C3|nr:hypothetical protein [Roseivirga sp. E12]MBO3699587.1 hypothetical protein [Roseivirga sp. E12]
MSRPFAILCTILLLSSCGQTKERTDVSAITYREFYDLMFEDYANRVEWHEDDFNQEATAFIQLNNKGACESENCGEKTFVKNESTDRSIRVIVKTAFSIPNTLPYIANQFVLAPGEEVYLTCTEFCLNDEHYDLDQSIVVAAFVND